MAIPLPSSTKFSMQRAYRATTADDAPDHAGVEATIESSHFLRILRPATTSATSPYPCMAPGSNTYTGCRGNACAAFEAGSPRKGCVFYPAPRGERVARGSYTNDAGEVDDAPRSLAATAKIVNTKTAPDRTLPHIWNRAGTQQHAQQAEQAIRAAATSSYAPQSSGNVPDVSPNTQTTTATRRTVKKSKRTNPPSEKLLASIARARQHSPQYRQAHPEIIPEIIPEIMAATPTA